MTHPAAHRYIPMIRWSADDGCYVGSCPPLIGDCCHGDDPARLIAELGTIMDEHLAMIEQDGVPLPSPTNKSYSGKLPLRISKDLHRALALRAAAAGDSLNQFIERTLNSAIGNETPRPTGQRRGRRKLAAG